MIYVMHISATACLLAKSNQFIVEQFIKPIAAGRCLTTLAFSEFGSGAHFYAPVSQAARRNGHFVLNCDKSFVTSAGEADLYVVSTRATNAAAAMKSDLFVVTREQAAACAEVSETWAGMGLNGNSSAPMKFSECAVPADQLLGQEGEGLGLMLQTVLPIFSLGIAAVNLGLAEAALRASVAHATARRYEHSGGVLAEIESIQHLVAEMKLSLDRTRALVSATAELVEAGDPQATLPVLEVKAAASETALEVTAKAMRVCGGAAYSKRLPVERFFRDSQAGNLMVPTTDILKGFIGKAVLGLPLF
jgi:alkylation response protein AidB-like acyl-CoA dehydrogenase